MKYNESKGNSYIYSFSLHAFLLLIFFFVNFNIEMHTEDYVTVGFGTVGEGGSSGAIGKEQTNERNIAEVEKQPEKAEQENKKVDLPEVKNETESDAVIAADDREKKVEAPPQEVKPIQETKSDNKGKEFEGAGEGSFGFEIDFGGRGKRKIYNYSLPDYPDGVSKEIDVKLRFTILPDGTVGRIIPLIKADARLESAAITSLRQWRFEPLSTDQQQNEQTAIITFPYRLQ
ncbi:MAG: energy transducer TonB [Melioribacteraceae bacterium]|nr:energy transducer TonB [Melioribacteraceae bacterium]